MKRFRYLNNVLIPIFALEWYNNKNDLMFIKILLLVFVFVGISFLALGFNIFFRKGKKFPQTSVGKNKEMRKLGLSCAKSEEIKCRRDIDKLSGSVNCSGCGLAS